MLLVICIKMGVYDIVAQVLERVVHGVLVVLSVLLRYNADIMKNKMEVPSNRLSLRRKILEEKKE